MTLAKDYQSVMGRSNEIQKEALGLDYSNFETSPISFDFDDEVNRLHIGRNRKNSGTSRCRKHTAA